MSSSSSHSSPFPLYCRCNEKTQIRVSKTSTSPEKKFHGCKKWNDGGCNFFKWCENTSTTHSQEASESILELERKFSLIEENKTSMVELERKILILEAEMKALKKSNNSESSATLKKLRCLEFLMLSLGWSVFSLL
ncbi:nuclear distribution protein PAC1 [Striga asiatica]|uniref:Nuclear distribution protein PAC1 n=1 Tax=Striga asiatica TaxID=4170 RepID=A0A5A7PTS5_STRAF|nr:nuclear distribution protein PAC1 [Striga asiatica]